MSNTGIHCSSQWIERLLGHNELFNAVDCGKTYKDKIPVSGLREM